MDDGAKLRKVIVDLTTGEVTPLPIPGQSGANKDPAAVSLGRRGGLKGGRVRAEKLSPERRAAIARSAAETRWRKKKQEAPE